MRRRSSHHKKVRWIGDAFEDEGILHYRSCELPVGYLISEGSFILVKNDSKTGENYVAQVIRLFEKDTKPLAKVVWYAQPGELKHLDRVIQRSITALGNEVFRLDNPCFDTEISIYSILEGCDVHFVETQLNDNEFGEEFVCRYSFDSKRKRAKLEPVIMLRPELQPVHVSPETALQCIENLSLIESHIEREDGEPVMTPRKSSRKSKPRTSVLERCRSVDSPGRENVEPRVRRSAAKSMQSLNKPRPSKKPLKSSCVNEWRESTEKLSDFDPDDVSSGESEALPSPPKRSRQSMAKKASMKSVRKPKMPEMARSRNPTSLKYRRDLAVELDRVCSIDDDFKKTRAMLHVSSVPVVLPCREEEFSNILSFVEGHLLSGTSGCMYISGTPGTGKTATFVEAMSCLEEASQQGDVPQFKFVDVNGMRLTSPNHVYSDILYQLTGQWMAPENALAALEAVFLEKSSSSRRDPTVLLVDELDLLLTSKQDILYNLFEWPSSKAGAKLIVVCIANTMDLPERVMMKRVSSRMGLTRVVFQPYSHVQLQDIISSRVGDAAAFSSDAIEFASRKVSALSGDARRALDICRRATEMAESENVPKVGISHIKKAFEEMFSSTKIQAIRKCSLHEQTILRAIVSEFRRCGLEEAILMKVYTQYKGICTLEGMAPLPHSMVLKLVAKLDAMKLVVYESTQLGMQQRVLLNMGLDDVLHALNKD